LTSGAFVLPPSFVHVPVVPAAGAALREPMDVKRWGLWAVLILASVVLGWMALRLSRQMGARAPDRDTKTD